MRTLSNAGLEALAGSATIPGYDRDAVTVGVVHLGVGAFHRAHLARYLDRLLDDGADGLGWGICGVGVLPGDGAMQAALLAQDCLYTLVETAPDGTQAVRVVGSIVEYLLAPDDPEAVVERMAGEAVRIVSLTITEGGYELRDDDPDVRHDVEHPSSPRTAFGLMAEALRRRREQGIAPFAVVSCDNLPGNGALARARLTAFARLRDDGLADWIERETPFPSSMVDRITAATTDAHRAELAERHGIEDRWPVFCEDYAEWILEDAFPAGRPPLESVGVRLVEDVEPYELMKLRLLNGSHQALAYLARLAGHRLVHEAAQDPPLRALLAAYMEREARPTLPPVPGIELDDYIRTLLERFSNPHVGDTIDRLCAYGSDRLPQFLVPVIRRQLETGGDLRRSATAVAGWARYCEGTDEDGEPIEVVDRRAERLTANARRQRSEPLAFVEDRELFGDLAEHEPFTTAYTAALDSLHRHGARATVEALADAPDPQHGPPGGPHG